MPTPSASTVGAGERLALMVFLALAVHAILILGISFDPEADARPQKALPSMEVVLVQPRDEEPPDQADYLAQSSQQGDGNVTEMVRPSNPLPSLAPPVEQPADADDHQTESAAPESAKARDLLTAPEAARRQETEATPTDAEQEAPRASELVARSRMIAQLTAELTERQQAYQERPRRQYISANTREYKYASYEEAWRAKVERVGNLNYPDEARRQGLAGRLLLDVAINPDGTIHSLEVVRSSGHKLLDDAAVRIVRLAAPFAPFPENIRAETDILHIIRTWDFQGEAGLRTRGG